jgi:predicted ATPase/DNA-binding SARP family transcriptional activator
VSRFRVLGPVEAWTDERRLVLGGPRQVKLLAFLLLNANRAVSADAVIDALWGSERDGAVKRLQMGVVRLRKALAALDGPDGRRLRTVSGGYLLRVESGELDAEVFLQRVREGCRVLEGGDPARGGELLAQALGLWRGPPLAEVAFEDFAQVEIRRLEELHLVALETRTDADLQQGRHAQLVPELEGRLAEHPTRERIAGQLMLALYRSGRQADALEIYQRTRTHLSEQLGLDPGPALQMLHSQILQHAGSIQNPPNSRREDHQPRHARRDDAAAEAGALVRRRVPALPSPPTAMIGRRREVDDVCQLLIDSDTRLVTLTGPGGVGKTRLALEIARMSAMSFRDGVCWIGLAGVASPRDVGSAILRGLAEGPLPGEEAADALRRYLARKRMLLVLDNFEHVVDAAELLVEVHDRCPEVTFLVTSRESLDLAAEHRVVVSPLSVPAPSATVSEVESTDAMALFVAAARRHDSRFTTTPTDAPVIARICARLDGLPLALELAAARTGTLGVKELATRLEEAATSLGSGPRDAPSRQRTLAATIDWSYQLLDDELRRTFARFAVFASGATLASAQAVIDADPEALQALIGKSLIDLRRQADGSSRLTMLETIRQFAEERLSRDPERETVRRKHLGHYCDVAERAASMVSTDREREGLRALDRDVDNIVAALRWALEHAPVDALRLAGALGEYWVIRSEPEAIRLLDAAIEAARMDAPLTDRARAQWLRSFFLHVRQQHAASLTAAEAALALYREAGDRAGNALALLVISNRIELLGDIARARGYAEDACAEARAAGDDRLLGNALARIEQCQPVDQPASMLEEAERLLTRAGSFRDLAGVYLSLAYLALKEDRTAEAMGLLERAQIAADRVDSPVTDMLILGNLGLGHLFSGELALARKAFADQLILCRGRTWVYGADEGLIGLGAVSAREGQPERAAELLGAARAMGYPPAGDQQIYDRLERDYFSIARGSYGAARWRTAETTGSLLSYEDAIAHALGEEQASSRRDPRPQAARSTRR